MPFSLSPRKFRKLRYQGDVHSNSDARSSTNIQFYDLALDHPPGHAKAFCTGAAQFRATEVEVFRGTCVMTCTSKLTMCSTRATHYKARCALRQGCLVHNAIHTMQYMCGIMYISTRMIHVCVEGGRGGVHVVAICWGFSPKEERINDFGHQIRFATGSYVTKNCGLAPRK